jgi:hypothetical protein
LNNKIEIFNKEIAAPEFEFKKHFYKVLNELVRIYPWLLEDNEPTDDQLSLINDIQASLLYFLKCKKEVLHPKTLKHLINIYWNTQTITNRRQMVLNDILLESNDSYIMEQSISYATDLATISEEYLNEKEKEFIKQMTIYKLIS